MRKNKVKEKKVTIPKIAGKRKAVLPDKVGLTAEIPFQNLQAKSLFVATPMYGGQCHGMYTRCLTDLVKVCNDLNIPLNIHFLFNESLIQRGRNYCCDEFIRARIGPEPPEGQPDERPKFSHMLFIDSDIGWDSKDIIFMLGIADPGNQFDVICAPYPKKCLPSYAKIETEDGIKTIAWIVNNKYDGKVLTLNEKTKSLEWNKVIDHSESPYLGKKWVSLQTSFNKPRSEVVTTFDHEIAYIDDVLNPEIKYTQAQYMQDKYIIKKPRKAIKNNINALLNKEQLSVLVGAILGDGCATKGGYGCSHSMAQADYCKFKANIFGGNVSNRIAYVSHQFCNEQTKRLGELIYVNGKKTLKNVINLIDEKSLAIMYMDDGHRYCYPEKMSEETNDKSWWYDTNTLTVNRSKTSPSEFHVRGRKPDAWRATSSIATHSFSLEDNLLLIEHIKEKFGIDSYIGKQKQHYYIKFDKDNTDRLHYLIAKYVPESMEYKLNDAFRGLSKHKFNNTPLSFAAKKVILVSDYYDKNNSHQYDIGVENNHNFFANGTLVHNCIAWEKIKVGVEKGYAEEDPNILEKFVGDYVFNPKNNTNIPLNQPVEILEGGTGFMLIQRQAFEKFDAKFPNQSYKPDHVRTKHFDGTREIMAYFDCVIDRGYTFDDVKDLMLKAAAGESVEEKAKELLDLESKASKRYLSEDYMFCQYLQRAGAKVWLCPWIRLTHSGSYVFGGSLPDLAQLSVSMTADPKQLKHKK